MTDTNSAEPIRVQPDRCHGCLTCQYRCSLRVCGVFSPSRARINVSRVPASYTYRHGFTNDCDGCLGEYLCVKWCPYGALRLGSGEATALDVSQTETDAGVPSGPGHGG